MRRNPTSLLTLAAGTLLALTAVASPTGRVAPASVDKVYVDIVDGVITVHWPRVKKDTKGQPLEDPSKVRYDVIDGMTREIFAAGVADSFWVDPRNSLTLSPPVSVEYAVSANIDGASDDWFSFCQAVTIGRWVAPCEYSSLQGWGNTFSQVKTPGLEANRFGNFLGTYTHEDGTYSGEGMLGVLNSSLDMDIWAFTPPTAAKQGVYRVNVDAVSFGMNKTNSFVVCAGESPAVDAMASKVIDTVVVNTFPAAQTNYPVRGSGTLTVGADGDIYLGLHAMGKAEECYQMGFPRFEILGPFTPGAPGMPGSLAADARRDGTGIVAVTFNVPAKTVDNLDLASVSRVELSRDGQVVNTWTAPAPGAALVFEDDAAPGKHTYTVTAFNDKGAGESAQTSATAFSATPKNPTGVDAAKQDDGTVLVTWTAPAAGTDGTALPEGTVTYNIYQETSLLKRLVAQGVSGTSAVVVPMQPERYRVADYLVSAVNATGESAVSTPSSAIAIGQAVDMPWSESFRVSAPEEKWARDKDYAPKPDTKPLTWGIYQYNSSEHSQDNDCGFLKINCSSKNATSGVTTPLIRIAGSDPVARMYAYANSTSDKNDILISVNDGTGWKVIADSLANAVSAGRDKYGYVEASLKEYVGKEVQLKFGFKVVTNVTCNLDNFAVFDRAAKNVGITRIEVNDLDYSILDELPPLSVGEKTRLRVCVRNFAPAAVNGGITASPAKAVVTLRRDGAVIGTSDELSLESSTGAFAMFTDVVPGALAGKNVTYTAEVAYADDQVAADNTLSRTLPVAATKAPAASQLAGSIVDDKLSLTWTAPEYDDVEAQQAYEDFEDWAEYGVDGENGWTMYDLDNRWCNFDNAALKSRVHNAAWFVMVDGTPDYVFRTYSFTPLWRNGVKTPMSNNSILGCDDWAVLPELSGREQTVSLVATMIKEKWTSVYTSQTGNETSDFVKLCDIPDLYEGRDCPDSKVSQVYRPFSFTVPEGTRYVAIRNKFLGSCASHFQAFDEVRFTPARKKALELKGYNVYRDGVLVNDAPVAATEFVQEGQPAGPHKYAVSAVYDEGESKPCAAIELESTSGILDASTRADEVARYAPDGREVDKNFRGIVIVKYSDGTARRMYNVK